MVYEDNGDIYITSYYRNTVTPPYPYYWSNEILLSDGSGTSSNPSISSYGVSSSNVACIVWQQYDSAIDKYHVKYRVYSSGGLQPPVTLSTTSTSSEPQPVVGFSYFPSFYDWHFVWDNGSGLKYAKAKAAINYIVDIAGTDANCHNPTVTDNWWDTNIGIAWDRNGDVYYQEVYYAPGDPYNPIGEPTNVSCGIAGNMTSSISTKTYWSDAMMLTWSASYEFYTCGAEEMEGLAASELPNRIIVARRKDESGNWGTWRYIQYGQKNISPSVGWRETGDYFDVIWEVENEDKLAMLSYLNGVGWYEDEPQVFSGTGIKTPSTSSWAAGDTTGVVWAVNTSTPFEIVHQKVTPATAALQQTLAVEVFREGIIHLAQLSSGLEGTLIVEFRALENISQNQTVRFAPESREKDVFMGSDYFSPPSNAAQYKLKVSLRGIGVETTGLSTIPNWEIFRAELKAAPQTTMAGDKFAGGSGTSKGNPPNPAILKRLKWEELRKLIKSKDFYIEKEYEIDLSQWTGDSVYIDLALFDNLPVEVNYAEEIRLYDASPENNEGALLSYTQNMASDELQNKIERYALYAAYPNPFNPTTTIAFDLPQRSFVEMKIYDISGRKVQTVISQNLEAGSHQAVWDGRDQAGNQVASGVYLYRIRAVPSASTQQQEFRAVNKMLLVR